MLNDRQIKNLKPREKDYKQNDEHGLYLHVLKGGGKVFRFDFAINGKRRTLTIGKYPAVSLSEARQALERAKEMIANGIDPAAAKQEEKAARKAAHLNLFENVARDWHEKNAHKWKADHATRIMRYLEKEVFPIIGATPIKELRVSHIKKLLDTLAKRGVHETAEKIRQWIGAIFNYAALLELADGNPAAPLQGYLASKPVQHMAALPKEELTEFYRRLLLADTSQSNRICVMLIMLCFARNNEIRGGKWEEIDFQAALWRIPAERMKRPRPHTIPLSDWAIELLNELKAITGHTAYLFPSRTKADGYISENTANKIINNMGYKGIATPHGFRSLASSVLNEKGFNADAIEMQLAHVEENKIRAAYNRTDYLEERKQFMQWYSDYLRQHYDQAKLNQE